jgi:hypothetical protein
MSKKKLDSRAQLAQLGIRIRFPATTIRVKYSVYDGLLTKRPRLGSVDSSHRGHTRCRYANTLRISPHWLLARI